MTLTSDVIAWDALRPGDTPPTLEYGVTRTCPHGWFVEAAPRPYYVLCTRPAPHSGRQHVAEGISHVLAVCPW
jgi:hypothetical protein